MFRLIFLISFYIHKFIKSQLFFFFIISLFCILIIIVIVVMYTHIDRLLCANRHRISQIFMFPNFFGLISKLPIMLRIKQFWKYNSDIITAYIKCEHDTICECGQYYILY
ncbi:hypothetical protein PAPYR_13058 [Paratrimastix pyriformis]|uniref:Uncharacterized protein n=1 Tax=Paratrimastix pyriformis TaxID=342808 RepID=A0ABQ8U0W9_9EUKA|nr:hypothetical protein PAPYR_13058 [Paratrimastix pyriformis]